MIGQFHDKIDEHPAKIEKVNEAQAHCESLHLSGIGIARERQVSHLS